MKNFSIVLIVLFVLTACQATKDALTLKKKSSADEFLVEKKALLFYHQIMGIFLYQMNKQQMNNLMMKK